MGRGVGMRVLVVGLVVLVLLVPLTLLRGLVAERQARAMEVAHEVAAASSGPQRLLGPLLVVDTEVERVVARTVGEGAAAREEPTVRTEARQRLTPPRQLSMQARIESEPRGRSLFSTLLLHGSHEIRASFQPPVLEPGERVVGARLVLGLGDARGLGAIALRVDDRAAAVEPGTGVRWLPQGVHAPLAAMPEAPLEVAIALQLSGTGALQVVPVGDETRVAFDSDWPHPGFIGDRLPDAPHITDQGFQARWATTRLSGGFQQAQARCGAEAEHCPAVEATAFGVRLVQPVDRYLMTERAMKYGLVVLVLVFGSVFLVEVLQKRSLHPIQYGLVGLALAVFFLLLLSLAEHLGFGLAYLLAASACSALVAVYLAGALASRGGGWLALGGLGALYGLLYLLLRSQDHALLLGSLLLFALLAALMLGTRRMRWQGMAPGG